MFPEYDVIVVGAGHAGCEAAAAAANLGSKVLLITMNMQNMAQMSCNPAMGGIAKGQIIREIDALGGFSGIVTDETLIQFRMLNKSKGPAMWSPRAQSDRQQFSIKWRLMLEGLLNLDFYQDSVVGLLKKEDLITCVKTAFRHEILQSGFHESPMFRGRIQGRGPRYCPSIEDKINRFAERERHQLFIEPEGWNTIEVYVNGFSSSLSEQVQYKALTKIPGFETC